MDTTLQADLIGRGVIFSVHLQCAVPEDIIPILDLDICTCAKTQWGGGNSSIKVIHQNCMIPVHISATNNSFGNEHYLSQCFQIPFPAVSFLSSVCYMLKP